MLGIKWQITGIQRGKGSSFPKMGLSWQNLFYISKIRNKINSSIQTTFSESSLKFKAFFDMSEILVQWQEKKEATWEQIPIISMAWYIHMEHSRRWREVTSDYVEPPSSVQPGHLCQGSSEKKHLPCIVILQFKFWWRWERLICTVTRINVSNANIISCNNFLLKSKI